MVWVVPTGPVLKSRPPSRAVLLGGGRSVKSWGLVGGLWVPGRLPVEGGSHARVVLKASLLPGSPQPITVCAPPGPQPMDPSLRHGPPKPWAEIQLPPTSVVCLRCLTVVIKRLSSTVPQARLGSTSKPSGHVQNAAGCPFSGLFPGKGSAGMFNAQGTGRHPVTPEHGTKFPPMQIP